MCDTTCAFHWVHVPGSWSVEMECPQVRDCMPERAAPRVWVNVACRRGYMKELGMGSSERRAVARDTTCGFHGVHAPGAGFK